MSKPGWPWLYSWPAWRCKVNKGIDSRGSEGAWAAQIQLKAISLTPAQETHQRPGMRSYWIDQPQPHLIPLPRDVLGHRRQHVFQHHVLTKTSSVVLRYILSCHSTTTRTLFLVSRNVSHLTFQDKSWPNRESLNASRSILSNIPSLQNSTGT